jgi:hypothetical protein
MLATSLIIAQCSRLIVTADWGFVDVLLINLIESLKIAFVIRAKESVKVFFHVSYSKV